jgi:hypothetical protein
VCVYSIHHHDRDGQGIEVKVLLSLFTGILLFFSLFFYYYYLFPVPFFFFVAELTLCVCVCICRCIHTTSIEYEWGRDGGGKGARYVEELEARAARRRTSLYIVQKESHPSSSVCLSSLSVIRRRHTC